jgi:hypothetical protein
VVADFTGGAITSNAGGLLLGATDQALGLVERFAACLRAAGRVVHEFATLVGQRVLGIALGYGPWSTTTGCATTRGAARSLPPLASKSTLNRLEHSAAEADRYRRISHDGAAIEALFVDLFLDARDRAPKGIVLELDATDPPLHSHQEGRFFHGYYDCHCYLPPYSASRAMPPGRGSSSSSPAEHDAEGSGRAARRFADFRWTTKTSWSRRRRIVAKGRVDAGPR